MKPGFIARTAAQMTRMGNRITITLNGIWMALLITGGGANQNLAVGLFRLLKSLSPRRVVLGGVLGALIVTPTVLYMGERARSQEYRAAYRRLATQTSLQTGFLESSIRELLAEQTELTEVLLDAGYSIHRGENVLVKVIATGYSSSIYQTDSTPFVTASNTRTREGILALSRDLLRRYTPGAPFAFGDRVHIPGLGDFIVEDSMNARWENRVDIWFPSTLEAQRFGVRQVRVSAKRDEFREYRVNQLMSSTQRPAINPEL